MNNVYLSQITMYQKQIFEKDLAISSLTEKCKAINVNTKENNTEKFKPFTPQIKGSFNPFMMPNLVLNFACK